MFRPTRGVHLIVAIMEIYNITIVFIIGNIYNYNKKGNNY